MPIDTSKYLSNGSNNGSSGGSGIDTSKYLGKTSDSKVDTSKYLSKSLPADMAPEGTLIGPPDLSGPEYGPPNLSSLSDQEYGPPDLSNIDNIRTDLRTNYPGGWLNPVNDINIFRKSAVGQFIDETAQAAGNVMGLSPDQMSSPAATNNKYADAAAKFIGGTMGYLVNPSQLEQNVAQNFFANPKIQQVAQTAGNKLQALLPDFGKTISRDGTQIVDSLLGKTVNKAAQGTLEGGLGAAAYAPFQTLIGGGDLQDIPQNVLEQGLQGAAFGGVLGGASPAVGKALSELFARKQTIDTPLSAFDEANSSRNVAPEKFSFTDPVAQDAANRFNYIDQRANLYNDQPLALPGQFKPTTARVGASDPNVYLQKYENLINTANQMKFTPGKELEEFESLWSRMADRNDPNLSELIDLAYPKQREIPRDLAQRARQQQYQREVAGVDGPVKSLNDLQVGRPFINKLPTFETKPQMTEEGIPMAADGTHLSDTQPIVDVQSKNGVKYYRFANSNTYFPENQVLKPNAPNERGVFTTLKESPNMAKETIQEIRNQGDTTYVRKSNAETLNNADQLLIQKGIEQSRRDIMENPRALNDDETAAAFKLLQHYQSSGDFESAAKVAHKLMTSGTENGRAVQINSIFSKLTPEGALRFASKIVQDASNDPKKILTAEQTKNITEAALRLQKADVNKDTTRDAINIISKLREGEKITPEEAGQLKRFAQMAERTIPKQDRQEYKDLQGKSQIDTSKYLSKAAEESAPAQPRLLDKVSGYTSKQADAARARIKARKGQLNSFPLDEWADYAIIGADYITRGAKTFAQFAEKMADDVGQLSYSQMNRVYVDAHNRFRKQNKIPKTDIETIVDRAINTHEIGKEDALALRAKAIELAQLTGRDKQQAEAMLHQQFQELVEPGFGKKMASLLRSSQLLNLRTTGRNIIANMMFYALDTSIRRASSVVDLGVSKLTGTERQIFWHNAPDIWKHFFGDVAYGAKEGFAGRNPGGFQTQFDLGNNAFNRNPDYKFAPLNWGERVGSFLERSLGAMNKSFDYASANMAMKNELYQMAQAKAYAEGLRGAKLRDKAIEYFHTSDEKMLEQAKEYGDYMTFQDKNFLSDSAQKIKSALNLGQDFGLGNIVLNYPKTPANILMRAIDYSPAGYLKFSGNFIKMAYQKNVDKKTLIQDFMRASGGTGIMWMAYELSKAGLINVLPSKDRDVNSLERSAGIISNSINVDGFIRYAGTLFSDPRVTKQQIGDYYASMDWLQPMAISASAGAAMAQSQDPSHLKTGEKAASAAMQSFEAALESAGNMSVLGNIKQAIMGKNPNNPNQGVMDRVGEVLSQVPLAFIPSLSGQLRNALDPKVRDTSDDSMIQQTVNQIKNKIPGLSETLPERYDTLGNPMENQFKPVSRSINALVNPSLMGSYEPNETAKKILDLIDKTGDLKLAPSNPLKYVTVNGQKVQLNPDQYRDIQQKTGQDIQSNITRITKRVLDNPRLTDHQKEQALLDAIKDARDRARAQIIHKYPQLVPRKALK